MNFQEFSYKRYKKFVYDNGRNENFEDLYPFVIKNIDKFSKESLISIKEILNSEITKARTSKTFSTFKIVKNTPDEIRAFKQILHYVSTYGFNLQGEDVYIDNPYFKEIEKEAIFIESISIEEFNKRVIKDLYTTLQWSNEEIEFIKNYISNLDIDITSIPSKEIKYILYKHLSIIPKNIDEFFGFLNYIATNKTLFVKNDETIESFKINQKKIIKYIHSYIEKYGIIPLCENFNRFKTLFLAVKESNKKLINKISKFSKKYHKPYKLPDYLLITESIKKNNFDMIKFLKIIENMDISYLTKLYNAVNYRIYLIENNIGYGFYKIRNGKIFIQKEDFGNIEKYLEVKNILLNRIKEKVLLKIEEKKFSLDFDKIKDYAVPVSGKQFLGDVPFGTKISGFNVVGVYWHNVVGESIDLDFSATNEKQKIGWNSEWKEENIIFSGDMTDAKNGASESFYITSGIYSFKINYFSTRTVKVDYTLWFGKLKNVTNERDLPNTSMIDNLVFKTNDYLDSFTTHKTIGLYINGDFYIGNFSLPDSLISFKDDKNILKSLEAYYKTTLKIKDLNLSLKYPIKESTKDRLIFLFS
ncbi:hypothetical protein [Nautilia lithotrophica]